MPWIRKVTSEASAGVKSYDVKKPAEGMPIKIKFVGIRLDTANPFAKTSVVLLSDAGNPERVLFHGKLMTHLYFGQDFNVEWLDGYQLRIGITTNAANTDVFRYIYWEIEEDPATPSPVMSNELFSWMFYGGKYLDNFETLGAVTSKTWTVPSRKRWFILGGYAERDQNASFNVSHQTAGDKFIGISNTLGAGTTSVSFGYLIKQFDAFDINIGHFVAVGGQKIVYTWGAAQTTPEVALAVLEADEP